MMSLGGDTKTVAIQEKRIHHAAIVKAIKQTTNSVVKGGA